MQKKSLLVADPYNNKQLEMISSFESENELGGVLTNRLREIPKRVTREKYEQFQRTSNELEQILLLSDGEQVIDYCLLNAYRDIRSCYLTLPTSKMVSKSKKMYSLATEYAQGLGMLEVFINVESYDRALQESLEIEGYESLGSENGITSFVKSFEKEGTLDGNNKRY